MNKKFWVVVVAIILVITGAGFGVKKYSDYQAREKERKSWLAPYYNETGRHILLSEGTDKLNNKQEREFYNIARGVLKSEYDQDFTNLDDYSLYVEKLKAKKTYHLIYVCESTTVKMRFKSTMTVKLDKESLKGETHFTYWDVKSDIGELLEGTDSETDE